MSMVIRKAEALRVAGTGKYQIEKNGEIEVRYKGIPTYWNQAQEITEEERKRYDDEELEDEFAVFQFTMEGPIEAFEAHPDRIHVDWVFIAEDAQRAADIEERAWRRITTHKRGTKCETGIIPDADKTSHYARRRFTF